MGGDAIMILNVNRQELNIETVSNTYTIADLLKYLEIDFKVIVEKNGDVADKSELLTDGDDIRIMRFAAGG
jgi:sulfur carrier protein ThiS